MVSVPIEQKNYTDFCSVDSGSHASDQAEGADRSPVQARVCTAGCPGDTSRAAAGAATDAGQPPGRGGDSAEKKSSNGEGTENFTGKKIDLFLAHFKLH